MVNNRQHKLSNHLYNTIIYGLLVLFAFSALFPFVNVLAMSFSSSEAIRSGAVSLWPLDFNLQAYKNLVSDGQLFIGMKNTVLITVVGTVLNMAMTIMAAYPLSKPHLKGRGILLSMIIFTMLFGGGLIPMFLLLKTLGITNTYWSLWLPGLVSAYNMFVMKTFFEGLPPEIEEAAAIDGARDSTLLRRIVLPLSMPVIAALTLFYAVGWWNSYYSVLIYITSSNKMSLMVKLYQMIDNISPDLLSQGDNRAQEELTPEAVRAAAVMIAALPILCLYPFLQKYFVKGVLIGSVKG